MSVISLLQLEVNILIEVEIKYFVLLIETELSSHGNYCSKYCIKCFAILYSAVVQFTFHCLNFYFKTLSLTSFDDSSELPFPDFLTDRSV